jgi:hypothetical protein
MKRYDIKAIDLKTLYNPDTVYARLPLRDIYKCHNKRYVLASIELWNRGLINTITFNVFHPEMNTNIIRNSYRMEKQRGY